MNEIKDIKLKLNSIEVTTSKTDLTNYYTKDETDTKLSSKADKTEIPDTSSFATKTELSVKADKSYIDTNLALKADKSEIPDTSSFVTKTELATKADKSEIPDVSTFSTKTELNEKVDKVSGKGLSSNDYTSAEKTKLAELVNYDDTSIKKQITNLDNKIGDINTVLDSINGEIV